MFKSYVTPLSVVLNVILLFISSIGPNANVNKKEDKTELNSLRKEIILRDEEMRVTKKDLNIYKDSLAALRVVLNSKSSPRRLTKEQREAVYASFIEKAYKSTIFKVKTKRQKRKTKEMKKYIEFLCRTCAQINYEYGSGIEFDPLLIVSVLAVESQFNKGAVSDSGAIGLMQLMLRTARFISGYKIPRKKLFEPCLNMSLGIAYFDHLYRKEGLKDWNRLIMGYNTGPRWAKKKKDPQNHKYVIKVMGVYKRIKVENPDLVTFVNSSYQGSLNFFLAQSIEENKKVTKVAIGKRVTF